MLPITYCSSNTNSIPNKYKPLAIEYDYVRCSKYKQSFERKGIKYSHVSTSEGNSYFYEDGKFRTGFNLMKGGYEDLDGPMVIPSYTGYVTAYYLFYEKNIYIICHNFISKNHGNFDLINGSIFHNGSVHKLFRNIYLIIDIGFYLIDNRFWTYWTWSHKDLFSYKKNRISQLFCKTFKFYWFVFKQLRIVKFVRVKIFEYYWSNVFTENIKLFDMYNF